MCPDCVRLQVADPPTDLAIPRIADSAPKSSCCGIVEGDQRGHPTDATVAEVVLTGPRQRESDAFPPISIADGEPVHVPSPPVPCGDQGADDLPISLGNKESGRGVIDQSLDVIKTIRRTCMLAAGLCPQVQYRQQVGPSAAAHDDFLAGQVRSIMLRSVFPTATHRSRTSRINSSALDYNPISLPRISFITSSVPPPIGPRRASRTARSMPYSRM